MVWNFAAVSKIGVGAASAFQIERSLRFNTPDSALLSRTFATTTDRQKWTFAGWVKRGVLGVRQGVFSQRNADNPGLAIEIDNDQIIINSSGDASALFKSTTAVFRDPAAFLHIVWGVDTTQAIAADRFKLEVNGVLVTAFGTNTIPAQNYQTGVNRNVQHEFGRLGPSVLAHFGGYMADVYFIDGSQQPASAFGEFDTVTGAWSPKAYAGTFGTNGSYLKFADNSNTTAATLGKDSSGNANNWTPGGFSIAAGVGNDSLVDTPTNYGTDTGIGGEVRGNYGVINPLNKSTSLNLNNGNLDLVATDSNYRSAQGTFAPLTGKWFYLIDIFSGGAGSAYGVGLQDVAAPNFAGATGSQALTMGLFYDGGNTFTQQNGAAAVNRSFSPATGDIFACAWDADAKKVWLGVWHSGSIVWAGGGDPAAGTTPTFTYGAGTTVAPFLTAYSTTPRASANFGQRAFTVAAPSGFKALCTQNLNPAIVKSSQYFDVAARGGTGSAATISDKNMQPDLVWNKSRSAAGNHTLTDSQRGANKQVFMATTLEEAQADQVMSFIAGGFTLGVNAAGSGSVNKAATSYMDWLWKKGVANGVAILPFTAVSGVAAVPHGLGVLPKFAMVKARTGTASGWYAWHAAFSNPSTSYVLMHTNAGVSSFSTMWGPSGHDATNLNFTVGNSVFAGDAVAVAFAEVPAFSSIGSYIGNASADGTFIHCGFRPRWFFLKRMDGTASSMWIYDAVRQPFNGPTSIFSMELTNAEDLSAGTEIDILSNGFKLRHSGGQNGSGVQYLYAAFAENPFKFARAR